jgi:hypothetical protein
VVARNGEPACEFVESLACARDPVQIVKTLPLALRHRVGTPLVKRIRAALKSSSASA